MLCETQTDHRFSRELLIPQKMGTGHEQISRYDLQLTGPFE
jgi:hypothetical protein